MRCAIYRHQDGVPWLQTMPPIITMLEETPRLRCPITWEEQDSEYVFAYRGGRIGTMHNMAWRSARRGPGLEHVRVHDLKHPFGRRLRAAGVSFEDRQDLLGHRSGRITTHYSAAELANLLEAANRVCDGGARKTPALTILKRQAPAKALASA